MFTVPSRAKITPFRSVKPCIIIAVPAPSGRSPYQLCDAAAGINLNRMGYLRCEACGAKALSAASQCPKCAHLFDLRDARGERIALKTCRSCGIMHRRDRSCQWCTDQAATGKTSADAASAPRATSSSRVPAVRAVPMRAAAGIAAIAMVAVGGWAVGRFGAPGMDRAGNPVVSSVATGASAANAATDAAVTSAGGMAVGSGASRVDSMAIDTLRVASSMTSSTLAAVDGDTIQWVPAVARTWVNVRRDAARAGDVIGVIKPSEKAMLGTGRGGWRLVKSPDVSGWVDPRLFEADSARIRG